MLPFPAASLPDPVAGKCSSLPAGPKIQHKRLITLVIIDKIGLISALKQKFSLISGRREPPPGSDHAELGDAEDGVEGRPSSPPRGRRQWDSVAVVGSIMRRTSVTLFAGKPLRRACS